MSSGCITLLYWRYEGDYSYCHEGHGELLERKMVREEASEVSAKASQKDPDKSEYNPNNEFLTVSELAIELHYDERTIRDMLNEGLIRGRRLKPGGKWLIPRSEVNRFKKGGAFTHGKMETPQQKKKRQALPTALIPKIEKLAKRLQWLIRVPEPERPLLTEEMIKGNAGPFLKVVRSINTPWWCNEPSIHVYLDLNAEQQALFNRLLSLPESQKFKTTFDEWVRTTNHYLNLVRSGGDTTGIRPAFEEARQTEGRTHLELWKAVHALY